MSSLDSFLFIALPYIAIVVFAVGTVRRYMTAGYGISSLSAQFLEGRMGFWGTVPFHIAILVLLLAHLIWFLAPDAALWWNGARLRLLAHEGLAFTFGAVAMIALAGLLVRRAINPRLRMVTSPMDVIIEAMLLTQIVLGCSIALGFRWGSSWFAADLAPYLWSIVLLDPQPAAVAAMPWIIKLHVAGAFLILLIFPFTRLVHLLVAPLHYLWRPYQVVIWHWDRKRLRDPGSAWQTHRPHNT